MLFGPKPGCMFAQTAPGWLCERADGYGLVIVFVLLSLSLFYETSGDNTASVPCAAIPNPCRA